MFCILCVVLKLFSKTIFPPITAASFPEHLRLVAQEVLHRVPKSLEVTFSSTTELSKLFDYLNGQISLVYAQVMDVLLFAKRREAWLLQDNGQLLFKQLLIDRNTFGGQEIIIIMEDMRTTGPSHLRTIPRRRLTEATYNLPVGVMFIKAILEDPLRYMDITANE